MQNDKIKLHRELFLLTILNNKISNRDIISVQTLNLINTFKIFYQIFSTNLLRGPRLLSYSCDVRKDIYLL